MGAIMIMFLLLMWAGIQLVVDDHVIIGAITIIIALSL